MTSKFSVPYCHFHFLQLGRLIYFCFRRETKTLAQRAKRARTSASSQPSAGASNTPLVVLSSPDSSPRCSPQRKFVTLFLLDMW